MIQNYSCSVSKETLAAQYPNRRLSSHYKASYNVHPGQNGWLVTAEDADRIIPAMWGLPQPEDETGERITLFMAEGTGISTSTTFRMSFRQRRCIVIADSYYVWRKRGEKDLVFRVYSRDMPLIAMGAIYEKRMIQGKDVHCFSIIQTEVSPDVKELYHKMPLILENEEAESWLSKDVQVKELIGMIRPLKRYSLQYYQVTNQLMNRGFNQTEAHSRKMEHLTLFDQ
jgi:putative SOS response-associated peptidase YedK